MSSKCFIYFIRELKMWFWAFLGMIPGYTGCLIRRVCLNKNAVRLMVWGNVTIEYTEKLTIGNNVSINRGCVLNCGGGVSIGNNVLIGPGVLIYSQNHNWSQKYEVICKQGYCKKAVEVEDDVWIAAGAKILPGVRLKKGTVVAAGAIVTKDTEEYGVYAGIPASLIGKRD